MSSTLGWIFEPPWCETVPEAYERPLSKLAAGPPPRKAPTRITAISRPRIAWNKGKGMTPAELRTYKTRKQREYRARERRANA